MNHRLAMMRGAQEIPALDVSRPPIAAAQVPEAARSGGDNPATTTPVAAAPEPEFRTGDRVVVMRGSFDSEHGTFMRREKYLFKFMTADGEKSYFYGTTFYPRRPTADEMAKYWPEDKP